MISKQQAILLPERMECLKSDYNKKQMIYIQRIL